MGMGRYILRRTALSRLPIFLAALFTTSAVLAASGPLIPVTSPSWPIEPPGTSGSIGVNYLPPRQNHTAPKAWSVNVSGGIDERAEVAYWIDRWRSEEGLVKLRIAAERVFTYRKEVDAILRDSGLPWEISAIPVVESNWRINAVSSSGAAGPWQFLESSARGRNLVIDAWRDDRRDPWRSTEAAVQELAFYDRLFSDWLIAVASYNAGPTRIRKLKEEGEFSSFWEMLDAGIIPSETRNYVPQVIAVAWVSSHAGRLGLPISWEEPVSWIRIPARRSIHLETLAEKAGVNPGLIFEAHGELNHPVTPPPTIPYSIKVPQSSAADVTGWLEQLDDQGAPERFWRYTVRSGDTLSGLAVRYGISLSELLSYNGHVRSGVLRIGERLYLPGNDLEPPGADSDKLPIWSGRYSVRPGDSFWSISRRYDVPPELLAEVNHRPMDSILLAGSVLKVPGKEEQL